MFWVITPAKTLPSIHWGDLPKVREAGQGSNLGSSSARHSKKHQHRKYLNLAQFGFNRQNKATQFASNKIGSVTAVWSAILLMRSQSYGRMLSASSSNWAVTRAERKVPYALNASQQRGDRWRERHREEEQSPCCLSQKDKRNKVSFEAYSLGRGVIKKGEKGGQEGEEILQ